MSDDDDMTGGAADPDIDPKGLGLHKRLLERDPTATEDLWLYFDSLARYATNQIFDPAMREDTGYNLAMNVIINLIAHPDRFDPSKGKSLYGYLKMDIKGDVMNHIAKVRREPRIISLDAPAGGDDDDVGNEGIGGNLSTDEPGPEASALTGESQAWVAEVRRKVVRTDDEGLVFDLQYGQGERSTETFAKALGISDLDTLAQARTVQQVKDRLATRLRRMREEEHR